MSRQKIAEAESGFSTTTTTYTWSSSIRVVARCCRATKRLTLGILMRILLPLVHLLLELLGLLFVHERQTSHTLLQLEAVKECAILVILKRIVDLLVPDNSTIGRLRLSAMYTLIGAPLQLTETSTNLSQNVFPTRSFASTTAPCRPVYVHRCRLG